MDSNPETGMKKIRAHEFNTMNWSGGTSTELFIYPPESSYAQRNFLFRFSTAEIHSEQSEFTSLPDTDRMLMVLEGAIRLTHAGQYEKSLRPFECDHFSGKWKTHSSGKGRDLNLMLREGYRAELNHLHFAKDEKGEFNAPVHAPAFRLYYIIRGECCTIDGNDLLYEGDLLVYFPGEQESRMFTALCDVHLAEAIVYPA